MIKAISSDSMQQVRNVQASQTPASAAILAPTRPPTVLSCLKGVPSCGESNEARLKQRGKKRRFVQFGDIHLHYHGYELSDNPAVSYGAALSITWEHFASERMDVIEREQCRHRLVSRAGKECPILSSSERYDRLRNAGYALEEIEKFAKLSKVAKQQREHSVRDTPIRQQLTCKLETIQGIIKYHFKIVPGKDKSIELPLRKPTGSSAIR